MQDGRESCPGCLQLVSASQPFDHKHIRKMQGSAPPQMVGLLKVEQRVPSTAIFLVSGCSTLDSRLKENQESLGSKVWETASTRLKLEEKYASCRGKCSTVPSF